MKVFIKKTKLNPHGTRLQIIIDGFKIDYWYIGYKASKATAYRKHFSLSNETEVFDSTVSPAKLEQLSFDQYLKEQGS